MKFQKIKKQIIKKIVKATKKKMKPLKIKNQIQYLKVAFMKFQFFKIGTKLESIKYDKIY